MTVATEPMIHFHARYKAGHVLAGIEVERGRECGCGRWFPQWVVSKAYLEALPESRRAAFGESCEIEQYSKGEAYWHPKRCHRCERRMIDMQAAVNAHA